MLLVGDDWAEDPHDVELMDPTGRKLAAARLPEGVAGITALHELIGRHLGENADAADTGEVLIGIETDRGLWVQALIAAGYRVFAINPLQVARYRERHTVSGAKSDTADAHTLADMVRTDAHQLRPVAGDTPAAEAVKVVARAHKTLIWERVRQAQRLRHALRDYFPAALVAFDDLTAADTLALLAKAPDPATAARLTTTQITAALRRARRRNLAERAAAIQTALRFPQLHQPDVVATAYAAAVRAQVAILATSPSRSPPCMPRSRRTSARTTTPRSSPPSPGSARSSAPGCSPSSATTSTATPQRRRARTTPRPARSPASPARRRPCSPGTCTTTGSSTPSPSKPSPP